MIHISIVPKVLIVEDLEPYQLLLCDIVSECGFQPDVAADLRKALYKLSRNLYHLVLVDLRLNDCDPKDEGGMQVLATIEEMGDPTARVVLTAYGTVRDAEQAFLKYHVDRFILKQEMDVAEVAREIQSLVNEAQNVCIRQGFPVGFPDALVVGTTIEELRRNLAVRGRAEELERALHMLFRGFYPLLPGRDGVQLVEVHEGQLFAETRYWSRALGQPVMARFGALDTMVDILADVESSRTVKYGADILERVNGVLDPEKNWYWGGVLYRLSEANFEDFIS